MLQARDRATRVTLTLLDVDGLPPVLATLLRPWTNAVENCCLGMGDHVAATAADASANIPRWVVTTPALKHMIAQAHLASDALAGDLDRSHTLAVPARIDAVATLTNLIASLRRAEPNAITVSLKLGW